ncbi:hypothetical protein [Bradyrhizobium sp. CCGB20]|uniref:hypothetical protein n=1 Tax=Bradyrhizobium sp. CCGB20 TaxID=2949633 RepID=UPI0020B1B8BB|nr:hypothetical protein [Bradyrhizobium sp. CCGB20]MCP3400218.1 hypothetical protein [Bradyrhizobium sp. CCGB20]
MSPKPPKPMDGTQLDAALSQLYDNPASVRARSLLFSQTIGCGDRQVRKWISGEAEVPRHIAMLVNLLLDTKTKPHHLRA